MAGHGDLQEVPLSQLFQRGEAAARQLRDAPPAAPAARQRLLQGGVAALERAAGLVDSLALFSPNEDADDVSTCDLKYLLVPHLRGELLAQAHGREPVARAAALRAATRLHAAFLRGVQQYALLSGAAARSVDAALDAAAAAAGQQPDGDGGGLPGSAVEVVPPRVDAAALRDLKIQRFKLERELRRRLEALEAARGGGAGGGEDPGEGAGAAEREAWLLRLELAALRSSEALGSLAQELQVVDHAASLSEAERAAPRPPPAPPAEVLAALRSAAAGLGLGGAAGARERLAAGVFKPSHILPTLTVEQQGDIEVAQAAARAAAEAARAGAAARAQRDRRAEDVEEEEVMKARAMDDWKDDNPRGWGNSKLRPCG
jgi:immunoglobulin-binding protein 1